MDTIDGMRTFAAVVDAGGFSAAAERLGLSRALASKYVAQLEQRLGVRLLNRTTRRVSLTDVGRGYYARSVRLLADLNELEETVRSEAGTPSGLLRIAAPRVFGEDALLDCLSAFMARYPDITVELALEERFVDVVAEGYDVAIRIGELADSTLIARRIIGYRYLLCASPDYADRRGLPETPAELAGHACIVNAVLSPTNQWEFMQDGSRSLVQVRPRLRVNSARAVRHFVMAGFGPGLCLAPTVEADLAAGRLLRVLEPFNAYSRSVYLLYPQQRFVAARLRAFIDFAADYFREG